MAIEIRVPEFGESVVEATVGRWLKAEGEQVTAGEPVVELETEKVNTSVAADEPGVLSKILHAEGETVHPRDVLGLVEPGQKAVGMQPERAAAEEGPSAQALEGAPAAAMTQATAVEGEKTRISPMAQRLAAELQVDLARVAGTGPSGRIMKEDVEAFSRRSQSAAEVSPQRQEAQAITSTAAPTPLRPSPPPPSSPEALRGEQQGRAEDRERLSRRRITIARRLVEAHQSTAMLTTFNEIDMGATVELRKRRRATFKEATGSDLGYMPFFVKATVGALKAFPQLNSELRGEELILKHYYDIGIAIGDPEGLVVPVLRDADRMAFAEIEQGIAAFSQKAKGHALTLEDLRGGTFTITNGGVFGSLLSTPMLNPPQVGILGMHKISERPMAVEGQVVVRPMMFVALTYDHRVIDGRDAVLFLARIKALIEDPERLLLEA